MADEDSSELKRIVNHKTLKGLVIGYLDGRLVSLFKFLLSLFS